MRHLVVVLGDQLDLDAAAFDGFDPSQDAVWMAEADEESTHVPSSQPRIALFLSAMRHFAQALRAAGRPVHYDALEHDSPPDTRLAGRLHAALDRLRPQGLVMTAPGDWRVLQALRGVAAVRGLPLTLHEDRHFFGTVRGFAAWSRGRRELRMEHFYREQRRRHQVLMDGDQPAGGRWNFDEDNREAFGAAGPGRLPPRAGFAPDDITREVIALVRRRFGHHPGSLDAFDWPVTRAQALQSLQRFIDERLPQFGRYEDAMWPGEPWLYHSQLSAALNLKLLHPREAVQAAEGAWREGRAPLASVEGFVRQILGWREYVRGLYWTRMPQYLDHNALDARQPLPAWYWDGETDMACAREAVRQTLRHGYAHHIQRLMVTGLYALLLGVRPREVHAWYLAVYVDAVSWVEVPNTVGMSQHADGGVMASKPYAASGQYIRRMGGPCRQCRFDPARRTGPDACPYTLLYWDFLLRHATRFARHPRFGPQARSVQRLSAGERAAIQAQAAQWRAAEASRPSPWASASDPLTSAVGTTEATTAGDALTGR